MLRATIQVGLAAVIIFAAILLGIDTAKSNGNLCHNIIIFSVVLFGVVMTGSHHWR